MQEDCIPPNVGFLAGRVQIANVPCLHSDEVNGASVLVYSSTISAQGYQQPKRRPVEGYDAPPMPWGSRGVEFRGGLEGDVGYTTRSRRPWSEAKEAHRS